MIDIIINVHGDVAAISVLYKGKLLHGMSEIGNIETALVMAMDYVDEYNLCDYVIHTGDLKLIKQFSSLGYKLI